MYLDIIGFIAAILTTAAFVPQVYKIWKLKSAKDVSLVIYLVMLSGVCLWEVYGLIIKSPPIIVANIVTALLLLMVIYFKLKFK